MASNRFCSITIPPPALCPQRSGSEGLSRMTGPIDYTASILQLYTTKPKNSIDCNVNPGFLMMFSIQYAHSRKMGRTISAAP